MKIETRDFGEMEIDPEEVVEFISPIYGFESLRRFVLLYDDNIPPFTWLQSIEEPRVCFIMVDPAIAAKDYAPQLPEDTKKLLQIEKTEDTVWRALTVIPHNFADSTMNLKSPVVINPANKCAAQIILEADYPFKAPLMGEDKSC